MNIKKKGKPTCLLSADWHIRGDKPVCRTDDYMEAQRKKIEFILDLSDKYSCPVLVAGDFGHRPIWGDKLLNWYMKNFARGQIITTLGQHDLLNHRLNMWTEGGVGVLDKTQDDFKVELEFINLTNTTQVFCFPYGKKIHNTPMPPTNIALMHQMVIKSQEEKLWHDQVAHSARWYLRKFSCYDLIVSGDNHQSFVVKYKGRWLVNPGSLMRMTANQIDHQPSVYLWYSKDNDVERVYLPIEQDVISREHLEVQEGRNERIESFVNRLKDSEELGLSYEKNLEAFFNVNRTRRRVKEKVWGSLE